MPLWQFQCDAAKNRTVTAVAWNPEFTDLFAVAYGSYDFAKQDEDGLICCYTLKVRLFIIVVFDVIFGAVIFGVVVMMLLLLVLLCCCC